MRDQSAACWDGVLLAHRVDPRIGPGLSGPGPQTFGVEMLGDLVIGQSSREIAKPIEYARFRPLMRARRRTTRRMLGDCATAPEDPECRPAMLWVRGQRDLGHHKAQQALAIDWRCRRSVPKRWQVGCQTLNV